MSTDDECPVCPICEEDILGDHTGSNHCSNCGNNKPSFYATNSPYAVPSAMFSYSRPSTNAYASPSICNSSLSMNSPMCSPVHSPMHSPVSSINDIILSTSTNKPYITIPQLLIFLAILIVVTVALVYLYKKYKATQMLNLNSTTYKPIEYSVQQPYKGGKNKNRASKKWNSKGGCGCSAAVQGY